MSEEPNWAADEHEALNVLIGKTVREVFLTDDKQGLKFVCDDGHYHFILDNDCCSLGWIEHISGIKDHLLGSTIREISYIRIEHVIPSRKECDEIYGVKFKGDGQGLYKGEAFLEFRNSSNGYYGSSIEEWKNISADVVWEKVEDDV